VKSVNLAARILDGLRSAGSRTTFSFHRAKGEIETLDGPQMGGRIAGFARGLRGAGLPPRTVVPLVATSSADLWAAFVGAMAAEVVPCILPVPTFKTHMPTYVRNVRTLLSRYRSSILVVAAPYNRFFAPMLGDLEGILLLDLESLCDPSLDWPHPETGALDVAFLQHSSGSTGTPKGVALSHEAVLGHLKAYADAILLDGEDRIFSWLPLYHDMGLITSFLLPLAYGIACDTIPPQDWILDPFWALSIITARGSTLAWWPNFAFALLARRVRPAQLATYDLRSLRMLINCSEPVLAASHEAFLDAFHACGIAEATLQTCYAMAENVFAVSQSSTKPLQLRAKTSSLALARRVETCDPADPEGRYVLSSGRPLGGVGIEVMDSSGTPCTKGEIGEFAITGPSLFSGYFMLPEATEKVLSGGRYLTGDIGFVWEGEIFVLGRKSDLIVVGGRKFYPSDIESIAHDVAGVREGRAVAFGLLSEEKGTEELIVLVESEGHQDKSKAQAIKKEIRKRVLGELDCVVDHVLVLAPRSLVKTSSGKIARSENRRLYLERSTKA